MTPKSCLSARGLTSDLYIHGPDHNQHTKDSENSYSQYTFAHFPNWPLSATDLEQTWILLKGLENWPDMGTTAYRRLKHKCLINVLINTSDRILTKFKQEGSHNIIFKMHSIKSKIILHLKNKTEKPSNCIRKDKQQTLVMRCWHYLTQLQSGIKKCSDKQTSQTYDLIFLFICFHWKNDKMKPSDREISS